MIGQSPRVFEYIFGRLNPFQGPCKGVANHALDLAYLHGEPEIFDGTENPEAERNTSALIKEKWILFAHNENPWDEEKVLEIGPSGIEEVDKDGFLESRKSGNWKALDALLVKEQEAIAITLMTHLVKLSSVE